MPKITLSPLIATLTGKTSTLVALGQSGAFRADRAPNRREGYLPHAHEQCPCWAWQWCDAIYQTMSIDEKIEWMLARKRYGITGYNLWMAECGHNVRQGENPPDHPSPSGGYSLDEVEPGTLVLLPNDSPCTSKTPMLPFPKVRCTWVPSETDYLSGEIHGEGYPSGGTFTYIFGDGGGGQGETVEHTFPQDGFYTILVIYSTAAGTTHARCYADIAQDDPDPVYGGECDFCSEPTLTPPYLRLECFEGTDITHITYLPQTDWSNCQWDDYDGDRWWEIEQHVDEPYFFIEDDWTWDLHIYNIIDAHWPNRTDCHLYRAFEAEEPDFLDSTVPWDYIEVYPHYEEP